MRCQLFILFLPTLLWCQGWRLVWSDEFDYSGLPDTEKWSYDTEGNAWDWGNQELQYYTNARRENARVEDGRLIIEAHRENWEDEEYTSARLITKNKGDWLYGRVDVRAKLPTGTGVWPAIWMLPTDNVYGNWPNSGEIDIMENVGFDPDRVYATVHTEAYNHTLGTQRGGSREITAPYDSFYVYSMQWFPDRIDFFANGDSIFSFGNEYTGTAAWPFDQRFHLLLNIAVGGTWGGQQGVDNSVFPQQMEVDYVRVYAWDSNTTSMQASFFTGLPSLKILKVSPLILSYELSQSGHLQMSVSDLMGRNSIELWDAFQNPGIFSISLSRKQVTGGLKFLRIKFQHPGSYVSGFFVPLP